jgi:hypothetical protein
VQALAGAGGGMYVTAGIVNGSQLMFTDNRAWTGAGMYLVGRRKLDGNVDVCCRLCFATRRFKCLRNRSWQGC